MFSDSFIFRIRQMWNAFRQGCPSSPTYQNSPYNSILSHSKQCCLFAEPAAARMLGTYCDDYVIRVALHSIAQLFELRRKVVNYQ